MATTDLRNAVEVQYAARKAVSDALYAAESAIRQATSKADKELDYPNGGQLGDSLIEELDTVLDMINALARKHTALTIEAHHFVHQAHRFYCHECPMVRDGIVPASFD